MPAKEILQDIGELAGCGFSIECENPFDDMIGTSFVGWIEIARLSRGLERAHDHARGVGTQVKRLPVQEGGLQQGALGSLEAGENQAPTARRAGRFCQARANARKLAHVCKTEKPGYDQLAAAIFIGAIGMQAIAAASGVQINQCHRQIIAAEKPGEHVGRDGFPFGIALRSPGRQAGSNRRRGFQRLLVEGARPLPQFAEAGCADRPEMTSRCGLLCHQPTQGS